MAVGVNHMRRILRPLLAAFLLCLLAAAGSAQAEETADQGAENLITMDFHDVEISALARFISEITGKNFVLDESVRGKVSVIAPSKVTPERAYSIFQSVLQVKGYTTVSAGSIIKIVPSRTVRESAELTQSQQPGETQGDAYVTRLVKLRNVDANSLLSVMQPMISRDGLVAAFPETNTLILTDNAYNIDRLLRIIGSLDAQGNRQDVEVIPLKLAFADDLAPKIEQIMEDRSGQSGGNIPRPGIGVVAPAARGPSQSFKIVPDERTNSLIVLAGELPMRQIKDLVAKLDIHSPNVTSRLHVYYLKNAQALEMVVVLGALLGGGAGPSPLSPQTGRASLGRSASIGSFGLGSIGGFGGSGGGFGPGFGGLANSNNGGSLGGGGSGGGGFRAGRLRSNSTAGGAAASVGSGSAGGGSAGGGTTSDFESPVKVTADPATNSLVISAAPQDYETLRNIIAQLDIPRRQVFVQAVIVEVSQDRARNLGVTFQSYGGSGSALGIGQLNYGTLQQALTNPLSLTGFGLGLATGGTCRVPASATGAAGVVPCDIALITALQQDTHSNVLSAPTLLTTDNEEAQIVVGQNVPFLASSTANSGLPNAIFSSVDRQNVGITLDIVPQVTDGGYVKLDVYEEVSAVIPDTVGSTLGPTTTIRSASTTVLVQNHRTTVIGGLLSDSTTNQNQGVPFLSSIPVLGNLFTNSGKSVDKKNLLVFLTPHVIRDREDLRELSLDQREKFLTSLGRKELHDLPPRQVRELYKPSFSISVPPGAELNAPTITLPGAPGDRPESYNPPDSGAPVPLNTEEIRSSARAETPPAAMVTAPAAGTTLPAADSAHKAAPLASTISAAAGSAATAPIHPAAKPPAAEPAPVAVRGATVAVAPAGEMGSGKTGGMLDGVSGLFGAHE